MIKKKTGNTPIGQEYFSIFVKSLTGKTRHILSVNVCSCSECRNVFVPVSELQRPGDVKQNDRCVCVLM